MSSCSGVAYASGSQRHRSDCDCDAYGDDSHSDCDDGHDHPHDSHLLHPHCGAAYDHHRHR